MIEDKIDKARAEAELEVENIFKHTLVEVYMKGFMRGLECAEDKNAALQRLYKEAEAYERGTQPAGGEQKVMLKPDAILKRKLKKDEFKPKVWRMLKELNCDTLGDILQVSERFFLSQKGFGMGSLNILRKYVQQFGYSLR